MSKTLDEAVGDGDPLIDLVVRFADGVDDVMATEVLNSLCDDISFNASPWYENDRLRIGQVTAEGALRHFQVCFTRVPVDKWNPETQKHEGYWDDVFRWSDTTISKWPDELQGLVTAIGATQPGANDDGQAYTPVYALEKE